jgi:hypothetical protein
MNTNSNRSSFTTCFFHHISPSFSDTRTPQSSLGVVHSTSPTQSYFVYEATLAKHTSTQAPPFHIYQGTTTLSGQTYINNPTIFILPNFTYKFLSSALNRSKRNGVTRQRDFFCFLPFDGMVVSMRANCVIHMICLSLLRPTVTRS